MRKLGEQWIEVIDDKRHLVMDAEASNTGHSCNGCEFHGRYGTCNYPEDDCPVQNGHYIKDLGIINENGVLPCPFCGEYPVFAQSEYKNWELHCDAEKHIAFSGVFPIKQEAIDAWNRRES